MSEKQATPDFEINQLRDALRREFRIKGQIGGEKDNQLDFVSIKRQIEMGQAKGVPEIDIVEVDTGTNKSEKDVDTKIVVHTNNEHHVIHA